MFEKLKLHLNPEVRAYYKERKKFKKLYAYLSKYNSKIFYYEGIFYVNKCERDISWWEDRGPDYSIYNNGYVRFYVNPFIIANPIQESIKISSEILFNRDFSRIKSNIIKTKFLVDHINDMSIDIFISNTISNYTKVNDMTYSNSYNVDGIAIKVTISLDTKSYTINDSEIIHYATNAVCDDIIMKRDFIITIMNLSALSNMNNIQYYEEDIRNSGVETMKEICSTIFGDINK